MVAEYASLCRFAISLDDASWSSLASPLIVGDFDTNDVAVDFDFHFRYLTIGDQIDDILNLLNVHTLPVSYALFSFRLLLKMGCCLNINVLLLQLGSLNTLGKLLCMFTVAMQANTVDLHLDSFAIDAGDSAVFYRFVKLGQGASSSLSIAASWVIPASRPIIHAVCCSTSSGRPSPLVWAALIVPSDLP